MNKHPHRQPPTSKTTAHYKIPRRYRENTSKILPRYLRNNKVTQNIHTRYKTNNNNNDHKKDTEDNQDLPKHLYNCANHTYIQKIPKPIICTTPYKLTTRTTELEQSGASSKEFDESRRMTHAAGTRDQHLQQEMNQSRKPTKKQRKNITRRISPFMPSFFSTGTMQALIRLQ